MNRLSVPALRNSLRLLMEPICKVSECERGYGCDVLHGASRGCRDLSTAVLFTTGSEVHPNPTEGDSKDNALAKGMIGRAVPED